MNLWQKLCRTVAVAVTAALASVLFAQSDAPKGTPYQSLQLPGIENAFSVGGRLFSGSSPEGDAAFAALQKLGVKTIITVDGAQPDVEAAARFGMRYVHIPIGYDGIPATNALRLAQAAATFSGPIYVHCHHGKHRGPAAVAVICEGTEGWAPGLAAEWLRAAGTATNYTGLYQSVAGFRRPAPDQLLAKPADFPERAQPSGMVETMVAVDNHCDALKAFRKVGFAALPGQPDLTPANEALILWEHFREARRQGLGASKGEKFVQEMTKAESAAADLHARLQEWSADRTPARVAAAEKALQAVTGSCASCHKSFRD